MKKPLLACALALGACRSAPAPRPTPPPRPAPVLAPPLETVQVPASGLPTPFHTSLDAGALYLLKASGAVALGPQHVDAEFGGFTADGDGPLDAVGEVDVGIDVGVNELLPARGRAPASPSGRRLRWFGGYRADHTYYLLVTGTGAPLYPALVRPTGAAEGIGAITIALHRLTPTPTPFPLGEPLETVMVPGREKVAVRSQLKGAPGAVYLLQAAGEIQVGGPGHMGDAEFHDYKADGRGNNEGEMGVDFGLAVDEPIIGLGHDPRARKWGPFRTDHTYYLLYAGTGAPIVLDYHDTGGKSGVYKDNEGAMPLRIFALP